MSDDDLAACRRMRACLVGIIDLDPVGVKARLAEIDREIARHEAAVQASPRPAGAEPRRIEVIPIGHSVKAA